MKDGKEKRNKIIFGTAVAVLVVIGIITLIGLIFTSPNQQEIAVTDKEDSKGPELSDARKELEKLYKERGTGNHLTTAQTFELEEYEIPFFGDLFPDYIFKDRMDVYLTQMRKIAKEKGEYDFVYNAISNRLIGDYQSYKAELSEEDCERFLKIINLCEKRLKTARVWEEQEKEETDEELMEEEEETATPTPIRLTDTRKKLETILQERGHWNSRSEREYDFLADKYDIPMSIDYTENNFQKGYNRYLDKMEKLAKKPGEWDLLYEELSDSLIWDYEYNKFELTEKQCERILKLIKLCQKREDTAKRYARE